MKPCARCASETARVDLIRCQSAKHRNLGDAFCSACARQYGDGFHSPFYCEECQPNAVAAKPKKRTGKPPKPQTTPKAPRAKKKRHKRLVRLRESLGMYQPQMALLLGISRRQYQEWECDEHAMPTVAKILCGYICRFTKETEPLAADWPEAQLHKEASE